VELYNERDGRGETEPVLSADHELEGLYRGREIFV